MLSKRLVKNEDGYFTVFVEDPENSIMVCQPFLPEVQGFTPMDEATANRVADEIIASLSVVSQ